MKNKNEIIKEDILQQIMKGILSPGQAIDTDAALSKRYDASRMTVRNAIDQLVAEGHLTRIYKKGAFVSRRSRYDGFRFGVGYSEEMRKRGMHPTSANVIVRLETPKEREVHDLQLLPSYKVWHVNRIRLADGKPIAYEDSYFPYPLIEELTEEDGYKSLDTKIKETYGYAIQSADQWIDAVVADEELARLLDVAVGTPLVRTYSVSYLPNGTPVNSGTCIYRTDNFKLIQSVHV